MGAPWENRGGVSKILFAHIHKRNLCYRQACEKISVYILFKRPFKPSYRGFGLQTGAKPVTLPKKFAIDKVLKKEVLPTGATRYLVSWDGYPKHFDSWVNELEVP